MPATGWRAHLPALSYALLAAFVLTLALRSCSETTIAIVASSLLMFACCWASATHLLGARAALRFIAIALVLGWFAEQMGSSRGWFFGHYTYTEVLGPRLGDVPVVIPLMWFALTYSAYVMANLIVWRTPVDASPRWGDMLVMSFLAAMIVTAFDLGADPYFIRVLGAWVMHKTDGWWFGETLQGFVGWMTVSFVIVLAFRWTVRGDAPPVPLAVERRHVLVPLGLYGSAMLFQMALGDPVETRTVAFFAMGMPLLCALAGWRHWQMPRTHPPA